MNITLSKSQKSRGFTLIEIVIVVVVIAILATLAFVFYLKTVSKSEDTEAMVNLGAIRRSELAKHDQTGTFVNATDTQDVNKQLTASEVQEKNFRYKVINATQENFVAIAERIKGNVTFREGPIVLAMYSDGSVDHIYSSGPSGGSSGSESGGSGAEGGGSGSGGGGSGIGSGTGSSGGSSGSGSGGSSSGGTSGGSGGGTGSVSGSGEAQVVDTALVSVLDLLKNSIAGKYFYDLIQNEKISLVYKTIVEPDPGYTTLAYWYAPDNEITVNILLESLFTEAAIAAIVTHEATHADYSYNPQKWIDSTLQKHPELTASDLHITKYPYTSIDQEYNSRVNEAAVWKELKGSQINSVEDGVQSKIDQGEAFYKDYLKTFPAYASWPDY